MQILTENSPDVVNFPFQGVNRILISYLCNIYLANKHRRIYEHTHIHAPLNWESTYCVVREQLKTICIISFAINPWRAKLEIENNSGI